MSIGSIFWLIGCLIALFSLIGIGVDGPDHKIITVILLFFGLGGGFGGIGWPAFNRT